MKRLYCFLACFAAAGLVMGTMASVCFGGVLPVPQKYQEQTEWCWDASSQAILSYYDKVLSQTTIAQYGTEGANIPNWLYGSSSNPTERGVNMILSYFASISSTGYGYSMSLANLTGEINALRPAVVRWGWDSGGGHILVAYGTDGNTVYLMDPWYGPTVNSYSWVCRGSSHTWTDTLKLNTTPPTFGPIIKANSVTGNVIVNHPANVSISVAMNAGGYLGVPVDWWVFVHAGSSWLYMNSAAGWVQEGAWHPMYQGGLFNLPDTPVLRYALPVGSYTFYFAISYPMNGILNPNGPILYDSVNVTVR